MCKLTSQAEILRFVLSVKTMILLDEFSWCFFQRSRTVKVCLLWILKPQVKLHKEYSQWNLLKIWMNIDMSFQCSMFCLLYCFSGDELDLWYQSNTKSCINGFNTNWIGCKKNVSNTFLLNELYSYWLMWTGFDLFLMFVFPCIWKQITVIVWLQVYRLQSFWIHLAKD